MFGNNFNGGFGGGFGGNNLGGFSNDGLGGFGQPQVQLQNYNFGAAPIATEQQGSITMEIRKIYLGLTRPQREQYRRSYDVVMEGNALNTIQTEVERQGAEAFNPLNMGTLMAKGANILRLSGSNEGMVDIENGWDRERFRFTMVVDIFRNGRFNKTEFISGYTDSASVMNAGLISTVSIDPTMIFTINHISEARQRNLDATGMPTPMITRANGVVRNTSFSGLGNPNSSLYMTRPSDVLRAVDKVTLYDGMNQAASFGDPMARTFQDLDSMLTNIPMMSADTNLLLPTFASRTLRGLYENSLNEYDPMNMDGMGSGSLASQRVQDTAFSQSGFVHVMNRKLSNGVTTTSQFSFYDLTVLDPTVDDRTEVFGRSYESGTIVIPDGRNADSIGMALPIAVDATAIAQTTLALMSVAGVATLAFNANNMKTGMTELTIQACDGMDYDGQLFQRLEVLKNRMVLECLNIVSKMDDLTYEVDVFADAFNDVFIEIYVDGERGSFVVPAFASSSFAPVVTNSLDRLVTMAKAIDEVVDTCKSILHPNAHNDRHDISVQGNGDSKYAGLAGDF